MGHDRRYLCYWLNRTRRTATIRNRGSRRRHTINISDQSTERDRLPFRPLQEQEAIVAVPRPRDCERSTPSIAKIRDAIDRLKELRTALISAAVTGKIDVREEVA